MTRVQWGIIGPGAIAHNFATGLSQTQSGTLLAIASTSAARREAFGARFGIARAKRHASYQALIADADVDAVYIATPHPFHAQWAVAAMRAGKAVLVEKPAGMSGAEVIMLTEVADQCGVFNRLPSRWS